tara:strand:+ start:35833 stop:36894 length:1062 start_codon:yes stop_codon:yes gene_type:complete
VRFSPVTQSYYLGNVKDCYIGYATNSGTRENCASGGIVSTILMEQLKTGYIDGALVSRIVVDNGDIKGESFIAKTCDEIRSSGGSIYFNVDPAWRDVDHFEGRLAVVGLPCHLKALNRICDRNLNINKKIVMKIGLFCGHNSDKKLLYKVLEKKKISIGDINAFLFRRGRWRGQMRIVLNDNKIIEFPFSHYSVYRNLNLFSLKRCINCRDHTAEYSDVSCGDIWLKKMKKEPIKHSIFLSRTQAGTEAIDFLIHKRAILARKSTPQEVFQSQKRALILHKGLYARSRVSRIFGMNISCMEKGDTRWNDYLAAFIAIANVRCSESKLFGNLVFRTPRQILYLYMLVYKLTHNF